MNEKFNSWLKKRPRTIREIGKKYPPGRYRIKEGAPYGISCPGTIVTLHGYAENGEVSVVVMAGDKLPEALAHERALHKKYGTKPAHGKNIVVHVDPKWLEPVELYVMR